MKFDDIDARMRVFETAHDHCVLPGIWIVARLDGRGFTRLTKDVLELEKPFDAGFNRLMWHVVDALMTRSGIRMIYGYQQSDEISLLFHPDDTAFGRKERKLSSTLAGLASAEMTMALGHVATFDCRISQLPTLPLVVDYFRWRSEDAARNALSSHCYWALRKAGKTAGVATSALRNLGFDAKNELLFQHGINFNELPLWQRRGIGAYWKAESRESVNPQTLETATVMRRVLTIETGLPMRDEYSAFVERVISDTLKEPA